MVHALEAIRQTPDPLMTVRATAVLSSHLRIHLDKEDAHLYPILKENTTDDEQISIVRLMSSKVPPERFPTLIQWLFPLLDLDDQVGVAKIWRSMMPQPVFAMVKPLIKKSTLANWTELIQLVPELSDK